MAFRVFDNGIEPGLQGLRGDLEASLGKLGVPPATLPLVTEGEELQERMGDRPSYREETP